MKNYAFGATVFASMIATTTVVTLIAASLAPRPDPPRAPVELRPDATLMRPSLKVDTSGGKVRVRGAFAVLRPVSSGRDHAVTIRLTIVRPSDEKVLYTEDLTKFNYLRAHPRSDYHVSKELNFDATGLDVKVAAVDTADGREFAAITTHGVAVEPAPGPRKE